MPTTTFTDRFDSSVSTSREFADSSSRYPTFHYSRVQQRGEPTNAPCLFCGGEGATHQWELCGRCRYEYQQAANAAVRKLRAEHPDWYPEY